MKPQQAKIIRLLAMGDTQKEIAAKLNTTTTSINNRIQYLKKKKGARTLIHLVVSCYEKEII